MRDRGAYWTAVPEWSEAKLERADIRIEAVAAPKQILTISGDIEAFLSRRAVLPLGPRNVADGPDYALRLAPDRVLYISETPELRDLSGSELGYAVADMTDGFIVFDVSGPGCLALLQQGTSYDLTATDTRPNESANIVFGGLRVAIVQRPGGWRLHVERPYATALWTWFRDAASLKS